MISSWLSVWEKKSENNNDIFRVTSSWYFLKPLQQDDPSGLAESNGRIPESWPILITVLTCRPYVVMEYLPGEALAVELVSSANVLTMAPFTFED